MGSIILSAASLIDSRASCLRLQGWPERPRGNACRCISTWPWKEWRREPTNLGGCPFPACRLRGGWSAEGVP